MDATQLPPARKPRQRIIIPERVAKRASEHFKLDPESGCHISTYSTASHGYAQIGWQDKGYRQVVTAHRAAWVAAHGQIPEGMTIDHLCRNRPCINVEHLRMLPNFENARRTRGRDWDLGYCINGHPNSRLAQESGSWGCPDCRKEWKRRSIAKQNAQMTVNPDDPRHGTLYGYSNVGCRCEPCRAAGSEYNRKRRQRTIS